MSKFSITEHYDTMGCITADSNPYIEFDRWQNHTVENPKSWRGDEFTIEDFQDHIIGLIEDEIRE